MKPSPSSQSPAVDIPPINSFFSGEKATAQDTRAFLKSAKHALASAFQPEQPVTPLLKEASNVVDIVLAYLFHFH